MSSDISGHNLRRRLQDAPAFVDFVVVFGLAFILFLMLRLLMRISNNWREMMKTRIAHALEKRKSVKDPFRSVNGYSWDYVMVFQIRNIEEKATTLQQQKSLKFIINSLAESGLQTKLFYSAQNDEVYCKIRAPITRLMKEADRVNYKLLLEPTCLANKLREGNSKGRAEQHWKAVEVPSNSIETHLDPYDYIYCDYRMEDGDTLYKKWPNGSIFRGVDRLKLIAIIIAARVSDGGCFLDVYRLIKDKCMISFFPLHDVVELRELEEKWLRLCQPPWLQHTDLVKNYFGEKIGLFFLWLGHYTTWLIGAAVLGFFAWINVAADDNDPSTAVMPYFATFVAIWSTFFLEYWKRKEKTNAMRWGMVGFEEEEQARFDKLRLWCISTQDLFSSFQA
jgi:anoctamin-10/anoctamin-7